MENTGRAEFKEEMVVEPLEPMLNLETPLFSKSRKLPLKLDRLLMPR